MPNGSLADVLKRQFGCVHGTLREAIEACPAEQWRLAADTFFAPARLAFHLVQATDFHLDANPKGFDWNRFGFDWEDASTEQLPDASVVKSYLDEVEQKVNARLEEMGDAGLLGKDYGGYFATALDHVIYALRHAQHHTGQINADLKERGAPVGKWR